MKKTDWMDYKQCRTFFDKNRFIKIIRFEVMKEEKKVPNKKVKKNNRDIFFEKTFSGKRRLYYTELKV